MAVFESIITILVMAQLSMAQFDALISGNICPVGCRCDSSTKEVICRNVDFSLGDFYRLPPWTVQLSLHRANIQTLFDRSFVTLRNLTSLSIQNSDLKVVEPNAFLALTRLRILKLPSNQLTELPKDIFVSTPNLEIVSLADNLISKLPAGLFDECLKMKTIRLEQNSMKRFHNTLFQQLPNLDELSLSSNLLQELPPHFVKSASVKSLDVSFNAIRFVSPDAFIGLPLLTIVNLSHNLLTHVNPVSLMAGRQLKSIGLDHNPLICDCQLAPLRSFWMSLIGFDSINQFSAPTCAWPHEFKGIAISKLNPTDFVCTTTTTSTTSTTTVTTMSTSTSPDGKTSKSLLNSDNETVMRAVKASNTSPTAIHPSDLPFDVIIASVVSCFVLLMTLLTAGLIICCRKRKSSKYPRSVVVTSPRRFGIPTVCKTDPFSSSTPYNNIDKREGDKPGNDGLSSSSSSSGSPPSPPSGSTSIPSSSQNCIFTVPTSNYPVVFPDGRFSVINSSGDVIQTVIDHLDSANNIFVGAPHSIHYGSPESESDIPNNIIVDMTGFSTMNTGTMVRSESLV